MTPTHSMRWITGLLWVTGLTLGLFGGSSSLPVSLPKADTLRTTQLVQTPDRLVLLDYGNLTIVRIHNQHLILGSDSLTFHRDTVNNKEVMVADRPALWAGYWSLLLSNPATRDSAGRWVEAKAKLVAFTGQTPPPADKANTVLFTNLIKRFLTNQTNGETLFVRRGQLLSERLSVRSLRTGEQLSSLISSPIISGSQVITSGWTSRLGVLLLALAGVLLALPWFRQLPPTHNRIDVNSLELPNQPDVDVPVVHKAEALEEDNRSIDSTNKTVEILPNKDDAPPVVTSEVEAANELPAVLSDEDSLWLSRYIQAFYTRYGKFYDDLQRLSIEPTDEEQRHVRRTLVEMALHAHSFMQTCRQHRPARLNENPNAQLLLRGQSIPELAPQFYEAISMHPYETEKRYRILLSILRQMDVKPLHRVLLDDRWVPDELL